MSDKRYFNRTEKNRLYEHANGMCEQCGKPLPADWHADHVTPYSKGGQTHLANGSALCPNCNLKKGSAMSFTTLRPFQRKFVDAVLNMATSNGDSPKRFIANVTPGSGKTLASLASADALMEAGLIDTVIHLSPRRNLAVQMEQDSEKFIASAMHRLMNKIEHRENINPLIRRPAAGYATTYASLMSDPVLHMRAIYGKKVLLICDELQQLGVDREGEMSTKSAQVVQELARSAFMVIGMTGTPYRADGSKLLFAEDKYSDPDENGARKLQADVQATYRMGVVEQYLRKFEFHLYDGGVNWNKLGEVERLEVSQMDTGLWRVLSQPEFWKPLVDNFIEHANEQRRIISPNLKDLIAAHNQAQAKEIGEYLIKRHNLKVLIAVSEDGDEAHHALRQFKEGRHTVLVTVNMAYIGYDYPAISHILPLTAYRAEGYLNQLIARGLRVMQGLAPDNQTCVMVAPNDPAMQQFANALRDESSAGLIERAKRNSSSTERQRDEQIELGYADDAWLGEMIARGYNPDGDADGAQFRMIEDQRRKLGIGTPTTQLIAFLKTVAPDWGKSEMQPAPFQPSPKTQREKESDAKTKLKKLIGQLCYKYEYEHPDIYTALMRTDGKRNDQLTLDEIYKRIKTVERWIEVGLNG